jgi:hypothetical protein
MPDHNVRWGVAIEDSHYGLIKDTVLNNWKGSGLITVTGNESYNVIEDNFAIRTMSPANGPESISQRADNADGFEGVGFWFRGFNNYVRNNVATNSTASGFTYFGNTVDFNIPLFRGADTITPGQFRTVSGIEMPILQFEGNETYGETAEGVIVWNHGVYGANILGNVGTGVLKDFRAWHFHYVGMFLYIVNNIVIDGAVLRNDWNVQTGWTGIQSGDYLTANLTIRNVDFQGLLRGWEVGIRTIGDQVIENSYLRNRINIDIGSLSGPWEEQHRRVIIRNVRFGSPPTPEPTDANIRMTFSPDASQFLFRDEIFVYDYNGVASDDFRIYYYEQRADFVVPVAVEVWGWWRQGSPVEGLTNQQLWDNWEWRWNADLQRTEYRPYTGESGWQRVAVAGAIAPSNAQERTGIIGLVAPI